ncbi:dethiobiotin synthase [Flavobacterium laiguense]|uniref:ATP-dependent dethiobiotin synthetase BioD n=1 Tax=Flavobacterium laiguense TaxID=2169409 RepID=A0A2U1JZ02_9FLAO|nr:dethiobiotin synthase [Flavobacterium laiguense]PWA10457.1 dethiobiotin synthase [Flavobacterium laiguense]
MKTYFITGIGTDIGKTIVSAILVEGLQADYWKPIQSGDLHQSDTMKVQGLISNSTSHFFPEAYRLTEPMSPHAAAAIDGVTINLDSITVPSTNNNLIIEGAGGLMVPLNNDFLVIDLIEKLKAEVILVSRNYLGSINHTLLSVEALQLRNIPIKGIIFNGNRVNTSENFICEYTGLKSLFHIDNEQTIDKQTILKYAAEPNIKSLF